MKYHYLDMSQYKRKSHFEYFNSFSYPFMGVTVNVDITNLIAAVKKKHLPFFLSFCYCVAKSANCVPEFRQRIINGRIAEYENCSTSHTVALEDQTYCYCTLDCRMPFQDYLPYAIREQENSKVAKSTEDFIDDVNELIFISTLPWISYTALVNPVSIPADSNPRITWGKYFEQNARTLIPISVLCNHALVDGVHLSQFYDFLNHQITELTDIINTML